MALSYIGMQIMKVQLLAAAVGVVALGLISGSAIAEDSGHVTVQASRVMKKDVGHTSSGIPIVDMSLSYGVTAVGLNLVKHADVVELEKRVNDAAHAACKELGRQYPDSTPGDAECARTAVSNAMPRVHELVAAAR
jgi:UrcA family protein